jgi:D-glycero-D-manno-heptose 1,7-bisphosphate phosphatase
MRLCILEKDGTIVVPKSGHQFVQFPKDQILLPGVKERIAEMKADDYTFVVCSNQGGIAAGHKTLEDTIEEMRYCMSLLPDVHEVLFCPDFEGEQCYLMETGDVIDLAHPDINHSFRGLFRKPNPGMLQYAIATCFWKPWDAPFFDKCLMIGDRPEDEQAAEAANISFMWANDWRGSNGNP